MKNYAAWVMKNGGVFTITILAGIIEESSVSGSGIEGDGGEKRKHIFVVRRLIYCILKVDSTVLYKNIILATTFIN